MTWILDGSDYGDGEPEDPPLAVCLDVAGAFADRPPRPRERFTLLGCRPGPALAVGAELLGELCSVAYDGRRVPILSRAFHGNVVDVRPSAHGDGLVERWSGATPAWPAVTWTADTTGAATSARPRSATSSICSPRAA